MKQYQRSSILVIGGAEDKVHGKEILQSFWHCAGGTSAIIGIIPSASREPTIIGERYFNIFRDMGAKDIRVLDVRDRIHGEDKGYQEYVEECTGIFMTGGSTAIVWIISRYPFNGKNPSKSKIRRSHPCRNKRRSGSNGSSYDSRGK